MQNETRRNRAETRLHILVSYQAALRVRDFVRECLPGTRTVFSSHEGYRWYISPFALPSPQPTPEFSSPFKKGDKK